MTYAYGPQYATRADVCAVIVAGGTGRRFGDARGKQFVKVAGWPVLTWSLRAFDAAPSVAFIVVVRSLDRACETARIVMQAGLSKPVLYADAGEHRQDSCRSGVAVVPDDMPFIAVHDAARPLVTSSMIERVCASVRENSLLSGAVCAHRAIDTLKFADNTTIIKTPLRSSYWCAQTPQVFRSQVLRDAYEHIAAHAVAVTDDASAVEALGGKVELVESPSSNVKITVPDDLLFVQAVLESRRVQRESYAWVCE